MVQAHFTVIYIGGSSLLWKRSNFCLKNQLCRVVTGQIRDTGFIGMSRRGDYNTRSTSYTYLVSTEPESIKVKPRL